MRPTTTGPSTAAYRHAIEALGEGALGGFNVILAANRAPVEFRRAPDGRLASKRGQGGLVTALASMVEVVDTTWVAAPLTPEDAQLASSSDDGFDLPAGDRRLRVVFVPLEAPRFKQYYDDISNSLLWFLQHGITHPLEAPEFDEATWSAWESYREVNLAFARTIARLARQDERRPVILIQDYHLYLVPLFLRRLLPDALILHFTHIPWPMADAWRVLPAAVREELLRGLLQCDLVGFHTPRYVRNFLTSCEELLGVEIDPVRQAVAMGGRRVAVRAYPISIDPSALRRFADGDEVAAAEKQLGSDHIARMLNVVQVARTDPSKNLIRSLKAMDLFLDRNPRFHGKVKFWGVLPASRQGCEVYRSYLERLKALSESVNRRYRRWGWQPVELTFENHYARAIACMRHYDVLLVNSLADGMNLVAKEGPIVNQRHGVLVLSETAGAWDELAPGAIGINPYDLVGMAEAIKQAVTMPSERRERLHASLCEQIEANPVFRWVHDQLVDLMELAHPALRLTAFVPELGRSRSRGARS